MGIGAAEALLHHRVCAVAGHNKLIKSLLIVLSLVSPFVKMILCEFETKLRALGSVWKRYRQCVPISIIVEMFGTVPHARQEQLVLNDNATSSTDSQSPVPAAVPCLEAEGKGKFLVNAYIVIMTYEIGEQI